MSKSKSGFTIIELLIFLVLILAVIASSELSRYSTRAKTAEAILNISKMADGARSYYLSERINNKGQLLPKQFPSSTQRTPSKFACSGKAPMKHDPRDYTGPKGFGSDSWQSLQFSMSRPFLYSYHFLAMGTGRAAIFSARAEGDLDCDQVPSLFEQIGSIDYNRQVEIRPLFRQNELE